MPSSAAASRPLVRRRPTSPLRRRQLFLEQLEDRRLLAVDLSAIKTQLPIVLGNFQTSGLDGQLNARLPILGTGLSTLAQADAFTLVQQKFGVGSQLAGLGASPSVAAVKAAIASDLAGAIITETVDDPDLSMASQARFDVVYNASVAVPTKLAFDTGLPALGFGGFTDHTDVVVTVNYAVHLVFGVNGSTFVVDTSASNELALTVDATLDSTGFKGKFGLLETQATDNGTHFHGTLAVNVASNAAGTSVNSTAGWTTTASKIDLGLVGNFGASTVSPNIHANFVVTWPFSGHSPTLSPASFGGPISVQMNDVALDGGSLFSKFLAPIINDVHAITEPFEGITDFLNSSPFDDLDLPSEFAELREFTYEKLLIAAIDIANGTPRGIALELGMRGLPQTFPVLLAALNDLKNDPASPFAALHLISDVEQLADLAKQVSAGDTTPIALGSFTINDVRGGAAPAFASINESPANLDGISSAFVSKANEFDGFHIDALEHPRNVFGLYVGEQADLFSFELPSLHYTFTDAYSTIGFIGIVPVTYTIGGGFTIDTRLKVVYDTAGLVSGNARDGFYVDNPWIDDGDHSKGHVPFLSLHNPDDPENPHLFELSVKAGAEGSILDLVEELFGISLPDAVKELPLNRLQAGLTVGGGPHLDGFINFSRDDSDEKLRFSEIIDAAHEDLACMFTITGQIDLSGDIDADFHISGLPKIPAVKAGPIEITPEYDPNVSEHTNLYHSPVTTVLKFDSSCEREHSNSADGNPPFDPHLADVIVSDGKQTLFLNVGPRAGNRNVDAGETNEEFLVEHVSGSPDDPGGETLVVTAFGYSQTFTGVEAIYVDAGSNVADPADDVDIIVLDYGVLSPSLMFGGVGDDELYGGDGPNEIHGEGGDDLIWGGADEDFLYGGDGKDTLIGFGGSDELHGNGDDDHLHGDDPDDASVAFRDTLYGGGGDDHLYGQGGDDDLFGGSGDDYLSGGTGNDTLQGESGANRLFGGSDSDTVVESGDYDFLLTKTLLTYTVGSDTLAGIEKAELSGGDSVNRFTVRNWRGDATLDGAENNDIYDVTYIGSGTGVTTVFDSGFFSGVGNDQLTVRGAVFVDPHGTVVQLSDVILSDVDPIFAVGRVLRADEGVYYDGVERLTVDASGNHDTVDVPLTTAVLQTVLGGDGDDTINVGYGDPPLGPSLFGHAFDHLETTLTIDTGDEGSNGDNVNVNESAESSGQHYVFTPGKIERVGTVPLVLYSNVELLKFLAGSQGDILDIQSPSALTTSIYGNDGPDTFNAFSTGLDNTAVLRGGNGDDLFNVASNMAANNGNLEAIQGLLTLLAGDGADRIYINDRGKTGIANYLVNATQVTDLPHGRLDPLDEAPLRPLFAGIAYDGTAEKLRLDGTDERNVFDVTPSIDTELFIDGNLPTGDICPPINGDFLKVNFQGTRGRKLSFTDRENGNGKWQFNGQEGVGVRKPIQFESIEYFNYFAIVAVGTDVGTTSQPTVTVFDAETAEAQLPTAIMAYEPTYRQGVRVAVGDVSGDGIPDIVTAPGKSHAQEIRVFDVLSFAELLPFRTLAYGPERNDDGTNLALADLDGDRLVDIITVPSRGTAEVKVFQANVCAPDPIIDTPIRRFFAFSPSFIGGASVATANLLGDGTAEIIVGSGSGMRATVNAFDVKTFGAGTLTPAPARVFTPFEATFLGGVWVAAGDVNGDGKADIIAGAGQNGGGRVETLDGTVAGRSIIPAGTFTAYTDQGLHADVWVVAVDTTFDQRVEIFTGQGQDGRSGIVKRKNPLEATAVNFLVNGSPESATAQGRVLGFNSITGQWTGSDLFTGETKILATWANSLSAGWQNGVMGDFDGDGVTDVAARNRNGAWQVGASQAGGFATSVWGGFDGTLSWQTIQVGDINADGKADIVGYLPGFGQWWVALSNGSAFTNHLLALFSTGVTWSDLLVADFTGDGRDDVAARTNYGEWWLGESSASAGSLSRLDKLTTWSTSVTWKDVKAADMNGDGKQDIVGRAIFPGSDGSEWWLAQTRLNAPNDYVGDLSALALWYEPAGWNVVIADTDGNGSDEILGRTNYGEWWQASKQLGRNTVKLGQWENVAWKSTLVGDVDGDGKEDLVGRKSNGEWTVSRFPAGPGSQLNSTPVTWSSSVDWLFSDLGEDDDLLFP